MRDWLRLSFTTMDYAEFKRGWISGRPETECGNGSRVSETIIQRKWLPQMVAKYDIHRIDDIGAGDLNWIGLVEWPHPIQYTPFDLVPRAPSVQKFDLINEIPRKTDLILCLWVLNHLPEAQSRQALANLLASGSKYLIYSYWPAMAGFLQLQPIESVVVNPDKQHELRLIRI